MKKRIELQREVSFVDFHSHVLPAIDDGSPDVDTSIEMLHMLAAQGVKKVVATPHFDATIISPSEFIKMRNESEGFLRSTIEKRGMSADLPEIFVGAEVLYFAGISRSETIRELCIGNTDLLLLEMPFFAWNSSVVNEALDMRGNLGIVPVIAHLDRYFSFQKKEVLEKIFNSDVLVQMNTEAFIEAKTSRKVLKMLSEGKIDFIGSDCHNLSLRAPNFDKAVDVILKKNQFDDLCEIFEFGNEILMD